MRTRKTLAIIGGILYLLLGVTNLMGLFLPEAREQVISLGSVVYRYSGFTLVGLGLLMLRKWAAYLWVWLMITNLILVYTVYGGQTRELEGWVALVPWIGPLIIIAYFYFIWPVLKPEKSTGLEIMDASLENEREENA